MEMIHIKTLWIQRKERHEGELAPECLLAVDEYTDDSNPEYWEEQSKKELEACGDEVKSHAIIHIRIPRSDVEKLLRPEGTIDGVVV